MLMQLHEFIALLNAKGLKPRQQPNRQWVALCPSHDDRRASLAFTESEGRILLHCFAGCTVDAICAALGITTKDLRTNQDFERRVAYEVRDPNGTLVAIHERIERNGKKTFVWRHPDGRVAKGDLKVADLPLYGVHKLQSAEFVVIVEGEKCAEALWSVGIPAVATYGATCDPADEPLQQVIERVQTIYLWADQDDAGRKHMARLGKRLLELGATDVRLVDWQDAPEKADAADAVKLGVDIRALLEAARPFEAPEEAPLDGATPPTTQSQQTQCPFCQLTDDQLLAKAQPVLEAENPVAEAAKRLCEAANIVAEDENAQLLLLIVTTRILPHPVHALVVGTTGAGKSALVNAISAAVPPCHRRTLIGTSARALLVHPLKPATLLNWLELPNLDSESIASTILRALLWQDGSDSADYLLTEWVSGRAKARTLKLPRQIALLSTRVDLPRDDQLVTRLFVVEVKETPEKRQSVLSAIARQWQDSERPDPDTLRQPVVAFMEWAQRRHWQVFIPFADALMALMGELPPAERDYRDAANLLRLVAASAIWHFQQRQHAVTDESLTVVADLADYALVRQLVAPTFAKTRLFALSEGERQIVDALQANGNPMTVKEIAQATNLSPTAVRCRLNRLKAKEIVADEHSTERREKVWRLVASTTLITDLLPTPEQVLARWRPDPDRPLQNSQNELPQSDESSSVHAFMSVHDPRTLENAKQDWDFCESVHAFADLSVQAFANHYQALSLQVDAISAGKTNVRENDERTNASQKTLSSISENERLRLLNACERTNASEPSTEPQKSETNLPIDLDSGLDVKIVCKNCGSWRRMPPDTFMLTDPVVPFAARL
jgi:DNA primase (bacterial type)